LTRLERRLARISGSTITHRGPFDRGEQYLITSLVFP
jgi:hypothetical protein